MKLGQIAAKTVGRRCIGVDLDVFRLCVVVEEGNAVPRRQEVFPNTYFHFACVMQDDSIMEKEHGCSFG